jgi:hypothetical protein
MIRMRQASVAIPRYELKNQVQQLGELAIADVRDDGMNRISCG